VLNNIKPTDIDPSTNNVNIFVDIYNVVNNISDMKQIKHDNFQSKIYKTTTTTKMILIYLQNINYINKKIHENLLQ